MGPDRAEAVLTLRAGSATATSRNTGDSTSAASTGTSTLAPPRDNTSSA